jgi:hypothetical protein
MFTRFVKPAAFKPTGLYSSTKIVGQARGLATVEGSAGRAMPAHRPRATPVSHDRATFTIRVRLESTIESRSIGNADRMIIGRTGLPWQVLRCQVKHLWRSCVHNLFGRLPRVHD